MVDSIQNTGITPPAAPAAPAPAPTPTPDKIADSGTAAPVVDSASVAPITPVVVPGAEPTEAEKRIRQLVAQRKEEERQKIQEQKEKEYWRGLAEGRKPGDVSPTPMTPAPANLPPIAPTIDKFEKYEEYEAARDSYLVAKTRWEIKQDQVKAEEKRKVETTKAADQKELDRLANNWRTKAVVARDKYVDFDTVVNDPAFVQSNVVAFLIQDSDMGPDLAYHLAKNPADIARLNSLPPHIVAKEIGVLEKKLASAPPVQRNFISQAPAPITTVAGGVGPTDVDEANLPVGEFVKRRNAKERADRARG